MYIIILLLQLLFSLQYQHQPILRDKPTLLSLGPSLAAAHKHFHPWASKKSGFVQSVCTLIRGSTRQVILSWEMVSPLHLCAHICREQILLFIMLLNCPIYFYYFVLLFIILLSCLFLLYCPIIYCVIIRSY